VRGEGGVGFVLALELIVDGCAELLDFVLHEESVEFFIEETLQDSRFEEHSEALVEPEMLPFSVRDEVAGPGVSDLVKHDSAERFVANYDIGSNVDQVRVLHATIGEIGGKHKDIKAPPLVRTADSLETG